MKRKKELMSKADKKRMAESLAWLFVWIFKFIVFCLISISIIIVVSFVYLISFIMKVIVHKFKNKKKLDKEVFIKTNLEKKCVLWIKKALTIFNDGMLDIKKEMRKQDKRNKRYPNSKARHCEICGRIIKVGKKYCYKCRKLKR